MNDATPRFRWIAAVQTAGLLGLFLLVPAREAVSQVRQATLEELSRSSTAVVVGKAVRKQSVWNESRTKIFTEVTLQVEESVKGSAAGETTITIPGGRIGNTLYEVSDMPVFVEGEQVLVFLWQHPSGKTLVTGASQGKMAVVDDGLRGRMVVPGAAQILQSEARAGGSDVVPKRMALDDVKDAVRRAAVNDRP